MPRGTAHGWGVCGRYIASELAKIANIAFITAPFETKNIGNQTQYEILSKYYCPAEDITGDIDIEGRRVVNSPVIQAITGVDFNPYLTRIRGSKTVGYIFFEENILSPEALKEADSYYDLIVTGSSWCEEVLRSYGFNKTETVIQGIDPELFHNTGAKEKYKDSFIIFSGGKLEFRKGQDLVIKAVKILQDRYPDVFLITSWYNDWPKSMSTMSYSPYIKFEMPKGKYLDAIDHLLSINGLDLNRTINLPPVRNSIMPEIYKNSDIGLFPNRCEGGTNLVLMEYMACGRPVIASYLTGHKDVLDKDYAFLIPKIRNINLKLKEQTVGTLADPDLDKIVDKLDWAYHNRKKIGEMGERCANAMLQYTWQSCANSFYNIVKETL